MNGDIGTFAPATLQIGTFADFLKDYAHTGIDPAALLREYDHAKTLTVLKSDHYTVAIDKAPPHGFGASVTIWHLSIKRNDREPVMDWRDLQAIKTAVCGADVEALQLFPAESRVVDTANQYHLFAFMSDNGEPSPLIPVGWTQGQRREVKPGERAKQRPMKEVQS